MMETIIALVFGVILGMVIVYILLRESVKRERESVRRELEREKMVIRSALEAEFTKYKVEWEEKIRKETLEASRAVIKGRVGEQFAPLLPIFKYNPSDARFIGSPVDLVVFDGYSNLRDGNLDRPLKVVFVEVKTSKQPRLTKVESAIKEAVENGRVGYEVIQIEIPEQT